MKSVARSGLPVFERIPRHVAIIMDGNGRWAKARKLLRLEGHKSGAKAVEETVKAAAEAKVDFLTLYAFSVENWTRPATEIKGLMALLVQTLKQYEKTLNQKNIRLRAIGRLTDLPEAVLKQLNRTILSTANNTGLTLVLALSYSGRVELVEAMRALAERVRIGELKTSQINEKAISDHLYTKGIPDPDLLIRTSGEMRLSNFLLWQISYTELYVTQVLWPDFGREEFFNALSSYNQRQRRFGAV
ncbi:MAG: isoprenyl transferase [Blastochloris sp.]|jgi:undecaprenyl diphosphate synthase|nr:isoprenyl transferase [Blastochloris sp.]